MRLLAEVDTAGEAVEGAHSLVYPLVHVPVARRREDLKYKVCGIDLPEENSNSAYFISNCTSPHVPKLMYVVNCFTSVTVVEIE